MNTNDIHIDIETLGRAPNAAVLSIGIVDAAAIAEYEHEIDDLPVSADHRFVWSNAEGKPIGIYIVFDLPFVLNLVQNGLCSIDADTMAWWRSQQDQNAAALLRATPIDLSEQLDALRIAQHIIERGDTLWCRGPSFDFPILNNLLPILGLPVPHFRKQRDVRTFESELGPLVDHHHVSARVKHHAFYDALAQAQNVNAIKAALADSLKPTDWA